MDCFTIFTQKKGKKYVWKGILYQLNHSDVEVSNLIEGKGESV